MLQVCLAPPPPRAHDENEDIAAMTLRPLRVPIPGSVLQPPNAEREEGFDASQLRLAN
jgi:hypothetical protein